jgi:hypothetical protein
MEGFLNFKLPVYKRVLLTRAVAIVPALTVVFMNADNLTNLDNILNVSQAVLLPFALIPLLKFVGSKKVMGDFALEGGQLWFAIVFGTVMYVLNFCVLFINAGSWEFAQWLLVLITTAVYIYLQVVAIREPITDLVPADEEASELFDQIEINEHPNDPEHRRLNQATKSDSS